MGYYEEFIRKVPQSVYSRDDNSAIAKLLRLYCESCDDLGSHAIELSILRNISAQTGSNLDELGKILKMSREGRSDADYRLLLRIAIQRNISNGSLDTIARIMKLISDTDGGVYSFGIVELFTGTASNTLNALNLDGTGPGYFDSLGFFNPSNGKIPGSFEVQLKNNTSGIDANKMDLITQMINKVRSGGILSSIEKLSI